MDNDLKIPTDKRHHFAQPLDKLISGTRDETLSEVEKIFKDISAQNWDIQAFLVGDIVTKDFLSNPFLRSFVRICIIDEKTQCDKIEMSTVEFFEEIIEFQNPAGIIQKESWEIIRKAINSKKKTLINVTEGEEDLLVIPLVLELDLKENVKKYVFYGQPPITDARKSIPEGLVMVDVNRNVQKMVKKLVEMMNKVQKPF